MAAVRANCPATYVANSAFCVLSMIEPGTAIEMVHGLPGMAPLQLQKLIYISDPMH